MTCSPKNLRKIPIFSRVIVDLDEPCGKLRNFRVHPVGLLEVSSLLGPDADTDTDHAFVY